MSCVTVALVTWMIPGVIMCLMLRFWEGQKPGHWVNYILLVLGWPMVMYLAWKETSK